MAELHKKGLMTGRPDGFSICSSTNDIHSLGDFLHLLRRCSTVQISASDISQLEDGSIAVTDPREEFGGSSCPMTQNHEIRFCSFSSVFAWS
jgi:hypothetical protein